MRNRVAIRLIVRTVIVAAVLLVSACSAKLDAEPTVGVVRDYIKSPGVAHSLKLTWRCSARSAFSAIFLPSGEKGCGKAAGRGEVTIPISETGEFRIPAVRASVFKFFSSPSFIIKWELLTKVGSEAEEAELLLGTQVSNNSQFLAHMAHHSRLRFFKVEDTCIPASITAVDAEGSFSFENLLSRYPDSREPSISAVATITVRNHGQVLANKYATFALRGDGLCAAGNGFFLSDSGDLDSITLEFELRLSANAYVVYEVGEVNETSGQTPIRGSYRKAGEIRNAGASLTTPIEFPPALVAPVQLEIDVSDSG